MALTSTKKIGDVVRYECDDGGGYCREVRTCLANENFSLGEVGYLNTASKMVACAAGVNDVQTLSLAAGTDGGTFRIRYKDTISAALAWNITAADMQTALRAQHADLAAVTVNLTSEVYTITNPTASVPVGGQALFGVENDITTDGSVAEGGIVVTRTSVGYPVGGNAEAIALEAWNETSDGTALFLVRGPAIVDKSQLTVPTNGLTNAVAALKLKGIVGIAEPTYTS